jgi:hypothetical protein
MTNVAKIHVVIQNTKQILFKNTEWHPGALKISSLLRLAKKALQ